MKVAHFVQFAPSQCGQYETAKELILAEKLVGIDAEMIDYGSEGGYCHVGKHDGHITTVHPDFAKSADILVRHSAIPPSIEKLGKPIVLCLHGRPESTFSIGFHGGSNIMKEIVSVSKKENYKAFITFWPEYVFIWENIIGKKVEYVSAPVDLERFNPDGKKYAFKSDAHPQILISDLWRDDITPFNSIFSALWYKNKYNSNAQINLFGLPSKDHRWFLESMIKGNSFGECFGMMSGIEKVYRSIDILVTPHIIATRTVREALASGVTIVGADGNEYSKSSANPTDIEAVARAIRRTWDYARINPEKARLESRKMAEEEFSPEQTGTLMKQVLESL